VWEDPVDAVREDFSKKATSMSLSMTAGILFVLFGAAAPYATLEDAQKPAGVKTVDPRALRVHIENLASRTPALRSRAARALIDAGEPALPALEETARKDPVRAELAGEVIDQITWGVELLRSEDGFAPPDPELLDLDVLKDLGMADSARRNPILIEALIEKMKEHDASMWQPRGWTPPLAGALNGLDQLRKGEGTPYDELEQRAAGLEKAFPSPREKGRIVAMVAHVYGQSGCRPRTIFWARKALKSSIPPELRLRMYEYWYSATLLELRTAARRASPEGRRELVRPALFGLKEAMRYDLPAVRMELPEVGRLSTGDGPGRDPAQERLHRRQVQARVAAGFLREMIDFRDIHVARVAENCAADESERRALLESLKTPDAVDALMRALRAGEDLREGLKIVQRRKGSQP